MDFTFGIITAGGADETLRTVIDTIRVLQIPNYEIIIVGKTDHQGTDIINISFNETEKNAWITRKKNIICQEAKYENIVLLHDYISFDKDWYTGFLSYGSDFDVCVNKIKTIDGRRFRDYTIYGDDIPEPFHSRALIPYDYTNNNLNKLIYISGSYYLIKKYIALKYPLNEEFCWSQGEDLEFSFRMRTNNILMKCNPNSTVHLLKKKNQARWEHELTHADITYINSLTQDYINCIGEEQKNRVMGYISGYL